MDGIRQCPSVSDFVFDALSHTSIAPKLIKTSKLSVLNATPVSDGVVVLNDHNIDRLGEIPALVHAQVLYLRDNFIRSFWDLSLPESLRILDLSGNNIDRLDSFPNLPHLMQLYLDANSLETIQGLPSLAKLEVLSLNNNHLSDLIGFPHVPNLELLGLAHNRLATLHGLENLNNLQSIVFSGNPLCTRPHWHLMLRLAIGTSLKSIDGHEFTDDENSTYRSLGAKAGCAVREGFLVPENLSEIDDRLNDFFSRAQSERSRDKPLFILHCLLGTERRSTDLDHLPEVDTSAVRVGDSIFPTVCLVHNFLSDREYFSRFVQSTAFVFRVENALGVALMGSWNNFSEGVPMTQTDDDEFTLVLYLTPGTYYYYYLVVEKEVDKHYVTHDKELDIVDIPISSLNGISRPRAHILEIDASDVDEEADRVIASENGLGYFRFEWLRSNDQLQFEPIPNAPQSPVYDLDWDDVGHSIHCRVIPVRSDGSSLTPILLFSRVVEHGLPECVSLRVTNQSLVDIETGDILDKRRGGFDMARQGDYLSIFAEYFGGYEGASLFQWSRLPNEGDGQANTVVSTVSDYIPTLEDVDHQIIVQYTPVRSDGIVGVPCTASFVPSSAYPFVSSVRLQGTPMQHETVSIDYDFVGGQEGDSLITWLRSKPLSDKEIKDGAFAHFVPITSGTSKSLHLSLKEVDCLLAVTILPVNTHGLEGPACRSILISDPVQPAVPRLLSAEIEGECMETKELKLSYEYDGGLEGNTTFQWYHVCGMDDSEWSPIDGAVESTYSPVFADVHKIIGAKIVPVRSDGLLSETIYSISTDIECFAGPPQIERIEIIGSPIQGETLSERHVYHGGSEGRTSFQWFRLTSSGERICVSGDDEFSPEVNSYSLSLDDVGHVIELICRPVRDDGVSGEDVSCSSLTILPAVPQILSVHIEGVPCEDGIFVGSYEYYGGVESEQGCITQWVKVLNSGEEVILCENSLEYRVSNMDTGARLRLDVLPRRNDGVVGDKASSATSEELQPNPPKILDAHLVGEFVEENEVSVEYSYVGGLPGEIEFEWLRASSSVQGNENLVSLCRSRNYRISVDDLDCALVSVVTPVRVDGVRGESFSTRSNPVSAKPPLFTSASLREDRVGYVEGGSVNVEVVYSGGKPGRHLFRWLRNGEMEVGREAFYRLSSSDVNCRLVVECTPVRDDGSKGTALRLESPMIGPGPPSVENVQLAGDFVEGGIIRVTYDYRGGAEGESQIQWFRIRSDGQSAPIPRASRPEYQCTSEDSGFRLQVEILAIRRDGTVAARPVRGSCDSIVRSLPPRIDAVEIEAVREGHSLCAPVGFRLQISNLQYSGGRPGRHRYQWTRSVDGNAGVPIQNCTTAEYVSRCSDINCLISCVVIPIREDGTEGVPFTSPSVQIGLDSAARQLLQNAARTESHLIQGLSRVGNGGGPICLLLLNKKIKVKSDPNGKTILKCDWSEKDIDIALVENSTTDLSLTLESGGKSTNLVLRCRDSPHRDQVYLQLLTYYGLAVGIVDGVLQSSQASSSFVSASKMDKAYESVSPLFAGRANKKIIPPVYASKKSDCFNASLKVLTTLYQSQAI